MCHTCLCECAGPCSDVCLETKEVTPNPSHNSELTLQRFVGGVLGMILVKMKITQTPTEVTISTAMKKKALHPC